MSDITKAFEILVSMDPTQATGAFKQIVDSQEKTTSSFEKFLDLGSKINQVWELFGKGVDAIKSLASSVGELADSGGELNELEGNFKKLAASAGIGADEFLASVKKATDGTLSLKEASALSSAAIVQGFSGPQILSAFKFAQQLSDQGKGNVEDLFKTITESTAKGRVASLAAFGIIAESGSTAAEVFEQIEGKIANAGTGFFNFGDNLKSITTSFGDFKDRVGQALNQSEAFQQVVEYITTAVSEFVTSFDFKPIGEVFDFIIKAGIEVAKSLGIDFGGIKTSILGAFSGGSASVQAFVIDAVKYFGDFRKTVYGAINGGLEALNYLTGGFADLFAMVTIGAAKVGIFFDDLWSNIKLGLFDVVKSVVDSIDNLIAALPSDIVERLGLSDNGALGEAKNTFRAVFEEAGKGAEDAKEENRLMLEDLSERMQNNADNAYHVFDGLKIDTAGIDSQVDELVTTLSEITPTIISNSVDATVDESRKGIDELRKDMESAQDDEKKRIKEHEELVKAAYQREADAAKEAFSFAQSQEEKAFRRSQEDALESFKKDIEKRREFRDSETGIGSRFSGDVNAEELRLREQALKEFRRSQEDAFDLFRREQKKTAKAKDEELKAQQKADAEMMKAPGDAGIQKLVEMTEEQKREAAKPKEPKKMKLQIVPTGNGALDQLLDALLANADVIADAENLEALAG